MSIALDAIDRLLTDWCDRTQDIKHGIKDVDAAIGLKIQHIQEVRKAVMAAEMGSMEEDAKVKVER